MVIGMSTVIGFLCTMVFFMHLSALFFRAYHRRFPEAESTPAAQPSGNTHRDIAIAIAVAAHQQHLQRGA